MTSLFQGSLHSKLYSKFRPYPPPMLIDKIINYLEEKVSPPFKKAIDIGCGSGQSTIVLSPYFKDVVGLDISEAQIQCAKEIHSASNIEYKVSSCEKLSFPPSSVDLVTFCQSVHWFNTKEIFPEVDRILIPNGVIATYGYWIPLPKVNDEEKNKKMSTIITEYLHEEKLGTYWDNERYIVQNHYSGIELPFKDLERTSLIQKSESSVGDYIGYLSTWSAYQKLYKKDNTAAKKLLDDVQMQLIEILGEDCGQKTSFNLHTEYFMTIGRHI